jgi:hypothetical protein
VLLSVQTRRTTERLAFIAESTITATTPEGRTWTVAQVTGRPDYSLSLPLWSPDGQWVLATDNRHRLLIVAADGDPGLRELSSGADQAAWLPPPTAVVDGGSAE